MDEQSDIGGGSMIVVPDGFLLADLERRKQAIAERLQQERKKNGLKQQDVSETTGINVVTLSGYEIAKNEPHMEALVRLADAYNVTLDYLMCRTDDPDQ